jgi:hypothetical protein
LQGEPKVRSITALPFFLNNKQQMDELKTIIPGIIIPQNAPEVWKQAKYKTRPS